MGNIVMEGNALKISGNVGISDAVKLRELLLIEYRKPGEMLIDLTAAESLDLACMQVLLSVERGIRYEGKSLRVVGEIPAGVKVSFETIGINSGMWVGSDAGLVGGQDKAR